VVRHLSSELSSIQSRKLAFVEVKCTRSALWRGVVCIAQKKFNLILTVNIEAHRLFLWQPDLDLEFRSLV
jgi:hypothetical protein